MIKIMEDYLEEYNFGRHEPDEPGLFHGRAEHVTRIARVLRQPRGNAMLVGVGGSGRQSLTRFGVSWRGSSASASSSRKRLRHHRVARRPKEPLLQAGVEEHVVFLFNDTQIVTEGFVEDINNILNSGEVPGLFAQDEKERMMTEIRPYASSPLA